MIRELFFRLYQLRKKISPITCVLVTKLIKWTILIAIDMLQTIFDPAVTIHKNTQFNNSWLQIMNSKPKDSSQTVENALSKT